MAPSADLTAGWRFFFFTPLPFPFKLSFGRAGDSWPNSLSGCSIEILLYLEEWPHTRIHAPTPGSGLPMRPLGETIRCIRAGLVAASTPPVPTTHSHQRRPATHPIHSPRATDNQANNCLCRGKSGLSLSRMSCKSGWQCTVPPCLANSVAADTGATLQRQALAGGGVSHAGMEHAAVHGG